MQATELVQATAPDKSSGLSLENDISGKKQGQVLCFEDDNTRKNPRQLPLLILDAYESCDPFFYRLADCEYVPD